MRDTWGISVFIKAYQKDVVKSIQKHKNSLKEITSHIKSTLKLQIKTVKKVQNVASQICFRDKFSRKDESHRDNYILFLTTKIFKLAFVSLASRSLHMGSITPQSTRKLIYQKNSKDDKATSNLSPSTQVWKLIWKMTISQINNRKIMDVSSLPAKAI